MSSSARPRIHLLGKHCHRTPFAYRLYRHLLSRYFEYRDSIFDADFIILGFSRDIAENCFQISKALERNQKAKLIVISEEPLWVTMWSEHKSNNATTILRDSSSGIEYFQLSCLNSDLFADLPVPYFITTEEKYLARYSTLLSRNTTLSTKDVVDIWTQCKYKYAYIGEKRQEAMSVPDQSNPHGYPLSTYRTLLAEHVKSEKLVHGLGWKSERTPRQALPDWHLNKLSTLHASSPYISAIENTYVSSYVTEKPFDALASLAIPVVWAPDCSELYHFIPQQATLQLYPHNPSAAAELIDSSIPSEEHASILIDTSKRLLYNKLTPPQINQSRRQLVDRLVNFLSL